MQGPKTRKIELTFLCTFGALKDSPLLDKIEADAKSIREMAKPRS